ncbi:hypothetical protein WG926_24770 [Tistrella sp. BH-R2-4]|uniref:ornithine decarboxylase n=1 Tax=Tistrella arctica TaxID=3133430 RepID=A0ABU9YRW9_9PROT
MTGSARPVSPRPAPGTAAALDGFATAAHMVQACRPVEPVYCLYPALLHAAGQRFVSGFGGHVLYAVKANPQPEVLRALYAAGIRHFDTASLTEIALIDGLFPDARCYFMAPAKLTGAAEAAFTRHGVRDFVADHASELDRLLRFADADTRIHIRMKAFDPRSVYELSSKFGATPEECRGLLKRVADAGLRPGLAFNVGSLCRHPDAYGAAIATAAQLAADAGVSIASLDVGGGFPTAYPGLSPEPLDSFFTAIATAAATAPLPPDCVLLCEPGRALVAEGQSIVVQVILIKDDLVFLNDGIYGSLKEMQISNESVVYPAAVIRIDGAPPSSAATRSWAISGPTCDSLDILPMRLDLPVDLREGDWIEFGLAGAYSNAMITAFNGFHPDRWVRIDDDLPPGLRSRSTPPR